MGENKNIQELDAFAKKYVKEIKQEKVAKDFTASLMDKIVLEHQQSLLKSKALISKKGWFIVFLFILVVVFIPFKTSEESWFSLPKLDLSFFDKIQIPNFFENILVSDTTVYAFLLFGLMIIAQVIFLKNYFDKRFS